MIRKVRVYLVKQKGSKTKYELHIVYSSRNSIHGFFFFRICSFSFLSCSSSPSLSFSLIVELTLSVSSMSSSARRK
jgi:hypothetical protein